MTKWQQYQLFSTVSKKVGGPFVLIGILGTTSALLGGSITKLIQKVNKKMIKNKAYITMSENGYQSKELVIKKGDEITICYFDDEVALIKINDIDEGHYILRQDLIEIIKKNQV